MSLTEKLDRLQTILNEGVSGEDGKLYLSQKEIVDPGTVAKKHLSVDVFAPVAKAAQWLVDGIEKVESIDDNKFFATFGAYRSTNLTPSEFVGEFVLVTFRDRLGPESEAIYRQMVDAIDMERPMDVGCLLNGVVEKVLIDHVKDIIGDKRIKQNFAAALDAYRYDNKTKKYKDIQSLKFDPKKTQKYVFSKAVEFVQDAFDGFFDDRVMVVDGPYMTC